MGCFTHAMPHLAGIGRNASSPTVLIQRLCVMNQKLQEQKLLNFKKK
jgi:hypothetical protein